VFEEGNSGYELFFIVSGIAEIKSSHSEHIIKSIADGCYFGDVAVLLGGKRTATIRATTNMVMSVIDRKSLLEVVVEYPTVHEYMVYIAEKRRLRLATLNPDEDVNSLTSEQMKDEEDSLTKWVCVFAKERHTYWYW
jgi:CRP-like cAMP-binding protein